METKANSILIGAFVLALMAAGFGFLYWLKGVGDGGRARGYVILFEGSVNGLGQAGSVLFNGLKVGKVRSLDIDPTDTRRIRVLIGVRPDTPIRENSRASVVSRGLTGYAAVHITPGTPDSPRLVAGAGEVYPIIKADTVQHQSLMEVAPEVLSNANAVFVRINDLIANNKDSIRRTVRNAEDFTRVLAANKANIKTIIANAKAISNQLRNVGQMLTKVERVATNLDSLITTNAAAISRTIANAETFTGALADKGKDVAAIIDEVHAAIEGLRKVTARLETVPDVLGNTDKMILRIDGLVEKNAEPLSTTIENARAFSETLKANKGEIDAIIKDAKGLSTQLKTVASKMEKALDQVSGLLGDKNGKSFIVEAREAIATFHALAVKLDNAVGDNAGSLTQQAKKGLKEFEAFMRDGRRAARSLDRVLTKIEQNPQSLIFGGSGVPEYNPTQ